MSSNSRDGRDEGTDGFGVLEPLTPSDPPRIGPYALLGRLGAGGMGRVYLARSEGGRTVAVKVVHEEHTSNKEFRARFRREVASARRVDGRYTAPVLDADPDAERPWVATGYVPGPSLEQVVREYGPLPTASVHALADGLLRALRGVHGAGIVHRDLKPSNVLLTVQGPRVIDFGIARAAQVAVESLLTSTGMVIGSPGFMAPEQILGEETGPNADVFALGCVLTYAATGRLPFGSGATNQHAVMYRIVESEPDLTGVEDEPLRALISRCLTKSAAERPDVEALLADDARPAPGRGAWLPAELVARIAQQATQLLDAETPVAGTPTVEPEPEPEAEPKAEAEPEPEPEPEPKAKAEAEPKPEPKAEAEAEAAPEPEPEPEPEAAEQATPEPAPRDVLTVDLQAKQHTPEPTTTATPARNRPRRRTWIVTAAVLAVLATGGTAALLLPDDGGKENDRATPPASSNSPTPSSPSPSRSKDTDDKDKDKDDGKDAGKEGDKGKDDPKEGGSGAQETGGSDSAEDSTGTDGDTAPDGGDGGNTSGSGGGSGSGGDAPAPSGDVPSYFVGSWENGASFGKPHRVTVRQSSTGGQAVTFHGITGAGTPCVYVATLNGVLNGGSRLDLGTGKVDAARSSAGCADLDPSYLDTDKPSGLSWFYNKDFTQDNQAIAYSKQ